MNKANPTFRSRPLDLAVDTITEGEIEQLAGWLREYPRLTMAGETISFERAWSDWLGRRYSVMCNSGSSANLLMYAALVESGRCPARSVVVPAAGWATTISPALQLGWRVEMCEVEPRTYGLCLESLEEICRKSPPDAVMVVHVLGVPADLTGLLELRERYGFRIIEDCCGSHGSRHRGALVGTFGEMSSFSFYYGHHMSTVEGGMVSTDDEELYHLLLMLRSHGWLKDIPEEKAEVYYERCGLDPYLSPFIFALPGYNLRPTDIGARIGLVQLARLDETVRRRAENHRLYQDLLQGCLEYAPGLEGDLISSISFCAVASSPAERRRVVAALVDHEIDTRIFSAGNLGRHPFWSRRYGVFSAPVADRLFAGGFFLPNNQSLNRDRVEYVCRVAREALA